MIRHPFLVAMLFLVAAVVPSAAQENEHASQVRHRNECRLAAQVLTAGAPDLKKPWARSRIGSCAPEYAVPALVTWWQVRSSDVSDLGELHEASRRVRDRRIYEVARAAVEDEARPALARIAALGVLAGYVEEEITLVLPFLEPVPALPGRWTSVWTRDNHALQVNGGQPLPSTAARTIVDLAHRLTRDASEPVRETARYLTLLPPFTRP